MKTTVTSLINKLEIPSNNITVMGTDKVFSVVVETASRDAADKWQAALNPLGRTNKPVQTIRPKAGVDEQELGFGNGKDAFREAWVVSCLFGY